MAKTKIYRVEMTAKAKVKGSLRVEATSQKEAEKLAVDRSGDVTWHYTELIEDDDSPDVASSQEE